MGHSGIVNIPCPPPPDKHAVGKLIEVCPERYLRSEWKERQKGFVVRVWLTEVERVYESEEEHHRSGNSDKSEKRSDSGHIAKNGASLVGITHMDELAYSIDGQIDTRTPMNRLQIRDYRVVRPQDLQLPLHQV